VRDEVDGAGGGLPPLVAGAEEAPPVRRPKDRVLLRERPPPSEGLRLDDGPELAPRTCEGREGEGGRRHTPVVTGLRALGAGAEAGATHGPALPESAPEDVAERGIAAFVICASLIRQFEFAQNVWINDKNFHELGNERDPLIGTQDGTLEFKIPKRPIRPLNGRVSQGPADAIVGAPEETADRSITLPLALRPRKD
jgi:hypothetical protein